MKHTRPAASTHPFELKPYLDDRRERVNRFLDGLLPSALGRRASDTPND